MTIARAVGFNRFLGMNKTEAAYATILELQTKEGVLEAWGFECLRLRIGAKCFYTPDFFVVRRESGIMEFHEVKGYWREDARVKIKAAATLYPYFKFWGVTMPRAGFFEFEEIPPGASVHR